MGVLEYNGLHSVKSNHKYQAVLILKQKKVSQSHKSPLMSEETAQELVQTRPGVDQARGMRPTLFSRVNVGNLFNPRSTVQVERSHISRSSRCAQRDDNRRTLN